MKTFVCTFVDGTSIKNAAGENIPINERIKQVTNGIRNAYVDGDFTIGPDHVMQVRCATSEATLFMKLTFANLPTIHVSELRATADITT
jgi:hypothetical protein